MRVPVQQQQLVSCTRTDDRKIINKPDELERGGLGCWDYSTIGPMDLISKTIKLKLHYTTKNKIFTFMINGSPLKIL